MRRAKAISPQSAYAAFQDSESALIAFNLACYARVAGHMEEAKARLKHAIDLDKDIRRLALDDEDLRSLWDWSSRIS